MCAPSSARSPGRKPSGVKGTYLKRVSLSSTMGPAVKVDLAGLSEETRA